jgi:hypothetical protein
MDNAVAELCVDGNQRFDPYPAFSKEFPSEMDEIHFEPCA